AVRNAIPHAQIELFEALPSTAECFSEIRCPDGERKYIVATELTGAYTRLVNDVLLAFAVSTSQALLKKQTRQELKDAALHDALTGLPNRRLFDELLMRLINQADRTNSHLGILYIDLDKFKELNDTHGHQVGDQLLQQVAARLLAAVRNDDVIARVGGDE